MTFIEEIRELTDKAMIGILEENKRRALEDIKKHARWGHHRAYLECHEGNKKAFREWLKGMGFKLSIIGSYGGGDYTIGVKW